MAEQVRGVLSVGDSIANGHGNMQAGLPSHSWAMWLASWLDETVALRGRGGATTEQVRLVARDCHPAYAIAALSVGTNDVLQAVPVSLFETRLVAIFGRLQELARTVLVTGLQDSIGRPSRRAGSYQAALVASAEALGAYVVPVEGLRRVGLIAGDRVHYTALGQLELARRAASVLSIEGIADRGHLGRQPPPTQERWSTAIARYVADPNHGVMAAEVRRRGASVLRALGRSSTSSQTL